MKKTSFLLCMALFVGLLLPSCGDDKKDTKITDIPATTNSPEALTAFKEGLAFSDVGDRVQAQEAFNKAISLDPKFGMAYLMRASTANTAKDFTDNIAAGKANVDSASSWEKWYAELMGTRLSGDRDRAMEIAQKIAAEYPDAARAQSYLGAEYSGNKQIDKARVAYEKAIQLDQKWPGGYADLANSYMFYEPIDLKKAETNALKVVELAPQSAGANIILGDCYRAQNDLQKAKESYTKAVSLNPNDVGTYYKLGHANSFTGNLEEARKNYTDGGTHDPRSTSPIQFSAYTYLYADNAKSATELIMDRMSANAELRAGQKMGCLSDVAEIAIHYNDAATLKSAVNMMNSLRDDAIADLGGSDEIKAFYKSDSLHWQAMVKMVDGKYDEAKNDLEASKNALDPIKDNRKLEGYEYDMGLIDMKQKNYGNAVSHFEKANLENIYNKYMLAKANEAAGNLDKANALYKEVGDYNFNEVGNALIRSEVKKKVSGTT